MKYILLAIWILTSPPLQIKAEYDTLPSCVVVARLLAMQGWVTLCGVQKPVPVPKEEYGT